MRKRNTRSSPRIAYIIATTSKGMSDPNKHSNISSTEAEGEDAFEMSRLINFTS